MSVASQDTVRNRLLRALSPKSFEALAPHLEAIDLPVRMVLVEAGMPIGHAYFVESGLASIVAATSDEERIEVGHVGREGVTGASLFLEVDRTPVRTFIQIAGSGLRISAIPLQAAVAADPDLRRLMLKYVHSYEVQLAYSALANGRYNMSERLARWLLMCHDRADGDEIPLTHEFLSLMLGVRRSGVTNELHVIEGLGAIKAMRGNVRVVDRVRLEEVAGGCYGLPEREYDRVIGPH